MAQNMTLCLLLGIKGKYLSGCHLDYIASYLCSEKGREI